MLCVHNMSGLTLASCVQNNYINCALQLELATMF